MVSITNKDQNTFNNRIDPVFNLSGVFFSFFISFFLRLLHMQADVLEKLKIL